MLSNLVNQLVVLSTPLIMVCLFIALIGLFIYFNRRIDRLYERVNTLSDLVSVLQEYVNSGTSTTLQGGFNENNSDENIVSEHTSESVKDINMFPLLSNQNENKGEKIVVSDDEMSSVSSDEEDEDEFWNEPIGTTAKLAQKPSTNETEKNIDLNLKDEDEDETEQHITVTKMQHSPEPQEVSTLNILDDIIQPSTITDELLEQNNNNIQEPFMVDDDNMSIVSTSTHFIPEPQLEEICTNAVLKDKFLSTNYRNYKVNQLRDLATEFHLIKEKEASKLKKNELMTFLDKSFVQLKNFSVDN